jgi:serine/threonine protein kinase
MEINFPTKKGIGLDKLLPSGCPTDLKDILTRLLSYDPNERITADQALKSDYFSEYANQIENLSALNNKAFNSTFFTMKQTHGSQGK